MNCRLTACFESRTDFASRQHNSDHSLIISEFVLEGGQYDYWLTMLEGAVAYIHSVVFWVEMASVLGSGLSALGSCCLSLSVKGRVTRLLSAV